MKLHAFKYDYYEIVEDLDIDQTPMEEKHDDVTISRNMQQLQLSTFGKYQVREIFSTHKQVGEKLDYPHFSSAVNEDYVKFNDKIVKIFRSNGVGKSWG